MRGKQAKLLRRIIDGLFPNLPDRMYLRQRINKKFSINTLSGLTTIAVPIDVVRLGECKRQKYQLLKRYHKRAIGAEAIAKNRRKVK